MPRADRNPPSPHAAVAAAPESLVTDPRQLRGVPVRAPSTLLHPRRPDPIADPSPVTTIEMVLLAVVTIAALLALGAVVQ